MNRQPAAVERLLEGLAPESPFRDAIIGDLAEEFRQRVQRDGLGGARRWYVREALRVSPHLLLAWGRGIRRSDIGHLTNVLLPSWVIALALSFFMILTGTSVLTALGYSMKSAAPAPLSLFVGAIGLVATATGAAVGGAMVASLHRQARFAAVLAFGMLYIIVHFSLSFVGPHVLTAPRWATELAIALGVLVGGAMRSAYGDAHQHGETAT